MYDRDLDLVAHGVKYAHIVAAVRWQLGGSWLAGDVKCQLDLPAVSPHERI